MIMLFSRSLMNIVNCKISSLLFFISRFLIWALIGVPTVLFIAGCDGDDGAPGATGPPGPPPTVAIDNALSIDPAIAGVTVSSPPVVQFTLADNRGNPIVGLPASAVRFTVAKLVPGSDGDPSKWQCYLTTIDAADGRGIGTEDTTLCTRESGSDGMLVDNGDGTYVYTFDADIVNDGAVPFDATQTHRVGLEIRGFVEPESNAPFTFRPDGMPVTFTREIVKTENCNGCHDKLAIHGNGRFDTQYCVTCHTPQHVDAQSTNVVDFKIYIHKIHSGASLPSLVNIGDKYSIFSSRSEFVYGEVIDAGGGTPENVGVGYPQDIRNCRTCHNETDPDTPDAGNWLTSPSMEACGSCHDDVNFATGENHSGANLVVTSNADCIICHSEGGFVGAIDDAHEILEQTAAAVFQFNIIDVTDTAPGLFPAVTFSITDPTNNGMPYDIQNDAAFIQPGDSRVAIDLGWDTDDYSNTGGPNPPSAMVSLDPLSGGSVDNQDGTFTVTSTTAIPIGVTGSGLAAIEGHPAVDVDGDGSFERIPVKGATDFFPITDVSAVGRRQVVNIANCLECHQQLSLHGSNRTDNTNLCVGCHNPNNTDINRRPADPADAIDGKKEQTIDFKRMIHLLHAGEEGAGLVVYGFCFPSPCVGNPDDFRDVEFPGHLNNCENCHEGDTFYPVGPDVLATTIDTGADLADPLDDINITPNAAVCSACHEGTPATEHMKQNGGAFDVMQQADGTLISMSAGTVIETCDVCHAEGRIADVGMVHGVHD